MFAGAFTTGRAARRGTGCFIDLRDDGAERGADRAGHCSKKVVVFYSGLSFSSCHLFSLSDWYSDLYFNLLIERLHKTPYAFFWAEAGGSFTSGTSSPSAVARAIW